MEAPVDYIPAFVRNSDQAFTHLMSLDWTRRDSVPRDEIYFNDTDVPYTYGSAPHARTYEPSVKWDPTVMWLRIRLEALLETTLDVCFLNRYMTARDQLGWHADDSPEMDPERPIVTVSLGAERDIMFRPIRHIIDDAIAMSVLIDGDTVEAERLQRVRDTPEVLSLAHGSAAIMRPGMQEYWQHRIPKSGRQVGPRISLTYRGYLPR